MKKSDYNKLLHQAKTHRDCQLLNFELELGSAISSGDFRLIRLAYIKYGKKPPTIKMAKKWIRLLSEIKK